MGIVIGNIIGIIMGVIGIIMGVTGLIMGAMGKSPWQSPRGPDQVLQRRRGGGGASQQWVLCGPRDRTPPKANHYHYYHYNR